MKGVSFSEIPISPVAEQEVRAAQEHINALTVNRIGVDIGAWIKQIDGDARLEYRVPNADTKHPSAIGINTDATDPTEVFIAGTYSTVRYELIGQRNPTERKLNRLYADEEKDERHMELIKKHKNAMQERQEEFGCIAKKRASKYSGITIKTDSGDASFSGGMYRPHVRLTRISTTGDKLGQFIHDLSNDLKSFYENLPDERHRM